MAKRSRLRTKKSGEVSPPVENTSRREMEIKIRVEGSWDFRDRFFMGPDLKTK